MPTKPVILCILDGWGHSNSSKANAIAMAQTPTWDRLWRTCPHTLLEASGEAAGLPADQFGNSEVGHTIIGAGRIPMQILPRINHAIQSHSIANMMNFKNFLAKIRLYNNKCHVLALLSPGGVHSHQHHLDAFLTILDANDIQVSVHAFTDGRDTPPCSASQYMQDFLNLSRRLRQVRLVTLSGRYYAMDRDNNWDRTQQAYKAIVNGSGMWSLAPLEAIKESYNKGITDEFIKPTVMQDYTGMQNGDGLFVFNFRADRVRQLLSAILLPTFTPFSRLQYVNLSSALGMTSYSTNLDPYIEPLFTPISMQDGLGELLAKQGKRQLRVAETEKYAHVTFFFNGGREEPFWGEDRILIPSSKVATYDLQPEMAAPAITDATIKAMGRHQYDFIVVNYANPDMVGHTGNLAATIKAVEAVDQNLARLEQAAIENGYCLAITADHGNAEQMRENGSGNAYTAHTFNPVPFVLVNHPDMPQSIYSTNQNNNKNSNLSDIAPTILNLLGIKSSSFMTGKSLIDKMTNKAQELNASNY